MIVSEKHGKNGQIPATFTHFSHYSKAVYLSSASVLEEYTMQISGNPPQEGTQSHLDVESATQALAAPF
jgi:hypothetical protein